MTASLEGRKCQANVLELYVRQAIDNFQSNPVVWLRSTRGMIRPTKSRILTKDEITEFGEKAIELVKRMRGEFVVSTGNPKTLAAATVYLASVLTGTGITQYEVAERMEISDLTIRNNIRKVRQVLNL